MGGEIGTTRGLFPDRQRDLLEDKNIISNSIHFNCCSQVSNYVYGKCKRVSFFCKCHHTNDVASPLEHGTTTSYTSLFKLWSHSKQNVTKLMRTDSAGVKSSERDRREISKIFIWCIRLYFVYEIKHRALHRNKQTKKACQICLRVLDDFVSRWLFQRALNQLRNKLGKLSCSTSNKVVT